MAAAKQNCASNRRKSPSTARPTPSPSGTPIEVVTLCRDIPQAWSGFYLFRLDNIQSSSYGKEGNDWRAFSGFPTGQWDTRSVETDNRYPGFYWTKDLLPLAILGSPSYRLKVQSPVFGVTGRCLWEVDEDNLYVRYEKDRDSTQVEVQVNSLTPETCSFAFKSSKGNRFGEHANVSGNYFTNLNETRNKDDVFVEYELEMKKTGKCQFQLFAPGTERLIALEPLSFAFEIQSRLTCFKGKEKIEIVGLAPKCPTGYKKK